MHYECQKPQDSSSESSGVNSVFVQFCFILSLFVDRFSAFYWKLNVHYSAK